MGTRMDGAKFIVFTAVFRSFADISEYFKLYVIDLIKASWFYESLFSTPQARFTFKAVKLPIISLTRIR